MKMQTTTLLDGVEATRWQVAPADIDECPFSDGLRVFTVQIALKMFKGERCFVVSQDDATGWTKTGKQVWLRHDVNAKHARHDSFLAAQQLAYDIVNGHVTAEGYTHWRERAARMQRSESAS